MQLFATPSSIPWTKTLVLCWVRYTIKLMPQLCIHTVFSYHAIHFITYAAHELYFNWLLHMLWQSFQIMWLSGFVCSKDFNVSGVLQLSSAAHGKIHDWFLFYNRSPLIIDELYTRCTCVAWIGEFTFTCICIDCYSSAKALPVKYTGYACMEFRGL